MATMILLACPIHPSIMKMAAPVDRTIAPPAATTANDAPARRWWQRWTRAARQLPPPAHEVALAIVVGAAMVAITNAIAIALVVPLPPQGWGLRLRHHGVEALLCLGVGGWLAAPAAAAAWLGRRAPRLTSRGAVTVGWSLYAGLCVAGMYGLLEVQLRRQSYVLLQGAASAALFPLYVGLCGVAVPAAHIVGGLLARVGWPRYLGAAAALTAVVVDHALLRDDYPGLHAAVLWVSLALFGAVLAERLWARLERARQWRGLALLVGAVALTVAFIHPSNAVRLQLFREPGAASSWALARTVWAPPEVTAPPLPLASAPLAEDIRAASLRGIASDPIVIVISIDALRADVLERADAAQRFPYLSRMRQRGAVFTHAIAAGSQTSVSLSSMFSGKYFSQMYWDWRGSGNTRFAYPADDTPARFPAWLNSHGVDTHGYLGIIFLSRPFGISGGFRDERVVVRGRAHASVAAVLTPLLAQLRQPNHGPQFYYAHIIEPHEPYDRGKLKTGPPFERYLSEVTLADEWIGKLVRTIQRYHRHRAYLLVTADHGEAFGEHGTTFHTKTLYDELLRVPLTLWGPGVRRGRIPARVSLIDIGPTVLHMFRQPARPDLMGRSLLPLVRQLKNTLPRVVAAEGRLRRALYNGQLKVIEDTRRRTVEVYDIEADPGELHNLFAAQPARTHPLVAAERAFFERVRLKRDGYRAPFKP